MDRYAVGSKEAIAAQKANMAELMAGGGLGPEHEMLQANATNSSETEQRNSGNNSNSNNNSRNSTPTRGSENVRDRLLSFSSPFLNGNSSNNNSPHGSDSSGDRRDSLYARGSPFLSGTFLSTTAALMQGSAPIQPITTRIAMATV
jgi:hypothetical protein